MDFCDFRVWVLAGLVLLTAACRAADVRLDDRPDLVVHHTQAWGVLGLGTAAHMAGVEPMKLHIGERRFTRGFGSHAPGVIVVDLGGDYDRFSALVGVQKQNGPAGSVVFRVVGDGKVLFDSGVVYQHTPPKQVSVSVRGVQSLELRADDAGDGITCDVANWCDPVLTPLPEAIRKRDLVYLDLAPFARVMHWDWRKTAGAPNHRLQEFDADELFPGTQLARNASGGYTVPTVDGKACVGLEWLERRQVRTLSLTLPAGQPLPPVDGMRVEAWIKPTPQSGIEGTRWQGRWAPFEGDIRLSGRTYVFTPFPARAFGSQMARLKVRWIWPHDAAVAHIRALSAEARRPAADVTLHVFRTGKSLNTPIQMTGYNLAFHQGGGLIHGRSLDVQRETTCRVRYTQPTQWRQDRSVLRFSGPNGGFGVAIDDLLEHGAIESDTYGIAVALSPGWPRVQQARANRGQRQTVLDRVRQMPEQTLARALNRVHWQGMNTGPTLLSLAANQHKVELEREGAVLFEWTPDILRLTESGLNRHFSWRFQPAVGTGSARFGSRSLHRGWYPIVVTRWREGQVVYTQASMMAPASPAIPGRPAWYRPDAACVVRTSMENEGTTPAQARVAWQLQLPEGAVQPRLEGDTGLFDAPHGVQIHLRSYAESMAGRVESNRWVAEGTLAPGERAVVSAMISSRPGVDSGLMSGETALEGTRQYWDDLMRESLQIDLPDKRLERIILANRVHCWMAARSEAEGERVAPWIGSIHYGPLESESHAVIRGMAAQGHDEFARRGLDYFIHRYNPQGFLTTGYTWMGTGWHLWTLGEAMRWQQQEDWLRARADEMARVCRWTLAQMEKTRREGPDGRPLRESGLMPPGVMADWDVYAYYFYLNGYFAAGLREAGLSLQRIGHPDAERVLDGYARLREATRQAYLSVQSEAPLVQLGNGKWIPYYPTQAYAPGPVGDMYPGEDAGRSWCYDVELGSHHLVPFGILDAHGQSANWMIDHLEDVQFLSDGWGGAFPATLNHEHWFDLGGFGKVQPYYLRYNELLAQRDDVKPFLRSFFNSLCSLLNREDLSIWEHFMVGAYNKTHETGGFLHQARTMLVMERNDGLLLAGFTPAEWLRDGAVIRVNNAPSAYGTVSYTVTSHVNRGEIRAEVTRQPRGTPGHVTLRLRHPEGKPIRELQINGRTVMQEGVHAGDIRLPAGDASVTVIARY